jgi:lipopolysaccharide/colanic/teichoic acid biosynthesis glycosyltransferase/glycosyltransferase involved in cell wall biosynthesis
VKGTGMGREREGTRRHICLVVASEMTVRAFLAPHLRGMQDRYAVTVVANTSNPGLLEELGVDGALVPLRLERRAAPWRDLAALCSLYRLFRSRRFDAVHSMTPKAGLLGMIAARLAGVPVRLHTFTGQVWASRRGPSRAVLRLCDALVARLATTALADSPSQREFLLREGVRPKLPMVVLGRGSVKGVDPAVFRPDAALRASVRARLNVESGQVLVLYVGRLTRDKGVLDLAAAFRRVAHDLPEARLVIVGPDEERLQPALAAACAELRNRVQFYGFTDRPQDFMAAADLLCLPSYREGIGTVIIEAAACGVPAVASRIYGIVDALEEGRTGLLYPPGDVEGLAGGLRRLIADPALRRSLGAAARERAVREFAVSGMVSAQLALYARVLDHRAGRGGCAGWYRRCGKRTLDVAVAGLALALLAPVLLALAVLIRLVLGAPVLFRQRRPGLHGAPFILVKFRSMTDRYDRHGRSLSDGERLTSFGRWLRASSLDELPELWNVLRGDMSLVGPRPLLMEYMPLYSEDQARRHDIKPGITGLAQVNGRNGLSWPQRFALDVEYVERCSPALDARIICRTVWNVLIARGVRQPGRATVDYFRGNAEVDG